MFPSLARFEHLGVFTRKPGFPAASQLLQDLRPRALARAHVVVAAAAQAMSHLGRASAVQCVPVPTWLVLLCYIPGGPLAAHRALTAFSRSSSLSTSRGSPVRGNVNPHGEPKASLPVPPGGSPLVPRRHLSLCRETALSAFGIADHVHTLSAVTFCTPPLFHTLTPSALSRPF